MTLIQLLIYLAVHLIAWLIPDKPTYLVDRQQQTKKILVKKREDLEQKEKFSRKSSNVNWKYMSQRISSTTSATTTRSNKEDKFDFSILSLTDDKKTPESIHHEDSNANNDNCSTVSKESSV